jgi:DNA-binding GntR family transcriptional regulator
MGEMAQRNEETAYAEGNTSFHSMIYTGAHNEFLFETAVSLRRRLAPFRRAQFHTPGRLLLSRAEHDAVVKTVVRGDAAGAHATMLRHVSLVEDAFDRLTSVKMAR